MSDIRQVLSRAQSGDPWAKNREKELQKSTIQSATRKKKNKASKKRRQPLGTWGCLWRSVAITAAFFAVYFIIGFLLN